MHFFLYSVIRICKIYLSGYGLTASFLFVWPHSHTGLHAYNDLILSFMLCCHYLEFLNSFWTRCNTHFHLHWALKIMQPVQYFHIARHFNLLKTWNINVWKFKKRILKGILLCKGNKKTKRLKDNITILKTISYC